MLAFRLNRQTASAQKSNGIAHRDVIEIEDDDFSAQSDTKEALLTTPSAGNTSQATYSINARKHPRQSNDSTTSEREPVTKFQRTEFNLPTPVLRTPSDAPSYHHLPSAISERNVTTKKHLLGEVVVGNSEDVHSISFIPQRASLSHSDQSYTNDATRQAHAPSNASRGFCVELSTHNPHAITRKPPKTLTEKQIRRIFLDRLSQIPGPRVTLFNDIDGTSPPLGFRFIKQCITRPGVSKVDDAFMSGCNCRLDNGRHVGCEYTSCHCLDFAATKPNGRKAFPYYCSGPKTGCLQESYLGSRNAIFECNDRCRCGEDCKNKNVQWGRKIPLEIFKTATRGWGIRCPKPLLKGQFVDIYRGEIITVQEADRREAKNSRGKDSYLYTLDKFAADNEIDEEDLYVVDGEFVGGVTRFINHSCEPNCRQFTVSYNHADPKIYDLAFFAMENIPAFTELTFDYLDKEEDHEDEGAVDPGDRKDGEKPTKCLCGAESCRKYLWL